MMPICPFCQRGTIQVYSHQSGTAWECEPCRVTIIRTTVRLFTPPEPIKHLSEIQLPTPATPRSEDVNATPQTDSAPPSEKGSG